MIRDLVPQRTARAMVRLLALGLAVLAAVCIAATCIAATCIGGAFCSPTSSARAAQSVDEAVLVVNDDGVATPTRSAARRRCRMRTRRRPTIEPAHSAPPRRLAAPAPVMRRVGAAVAAWRGPPAFAVSFA